MSEEILINVTPRETRVALVENGMLQEVHVERASRRGYVGNIYKGKVSRVMPGMQAAFVEIGLDRAAFLHASDIVRPVTPLIADNGDATPAPPPPIGELVRDGQDIVVQVVKDPIGTKGARLTTHLSIPSRYLVLLPYSKVLGVSVRIEDEAERARLKDMLAELTAPAPDAAALGPQPSALSDNPSLERSPVAIHGSPSAAGGPLRPRSLGYIVRTNAEGESREALAEDIDYLGKLWATVKENIARTRVGERIYEDLSLPLRALRDLMRPTIEKVRVDSRETLERAQRFVQQFMPELAERVEHYPGERPIFDLYGVEDEIQKALKKDVPLKSGGYLIVDQTEAMTTIDVNTGGFLGSRNLEETVFRTNLEAAQAAARQLRLRNLGGIIIIDFIDMTDEEHQRQVLRQLQKSMARDHAKATVYDMSPLGLVEMTRKRTTESLERQLCEPCATCGGRGSLKTAETITYEIFREITRAVRQFDAKQLLVLAAPKVVNRILEEDSTAVAELEEFIGKTIRFQPEEHYSQEQYDVVLL
ncbi:Rne/Rng family ribonuclease [Dokdonella soli]|uniref:Ribonuclease G n=1 Tax=Dokdonella soli TaxID=529810 RepID=A0ABN1ISU6_9GAMM